MKQALVFTLIFCFLIQTNGLSIFTDSSDNSSTLLDISDTDSKTVDVFRQLLNQETIIRMSLVKNVHALMKDMLDLKKSMETLETSQQKTDVEVAALKQEVDKLKRQNQRFELEHRRYEETFRAVTENFTKIDEHIQQVVAQLEEERENFETNTSAVLEDLKVEVRYLSVTLLDLNKHTLEIDKKFPEMIEEKYEQISLRLNTSVESLNSDIMTTNKTMLKSMSDLEHSQIIIQNSISVDINKTLDELMAEVKQSKYDQLQLSSTVSSLEVFRMNLTNNIFGKKVVFSATMTSSDTSWSGGTLVFPSVITNEENGYNPSNGIFTAPIGGTYVFFVNVQSYSSQTMYVDIVLNGSTKVRTMAYSDNYEAGPNMVVLTIQKGDAVWVRHYSGTGYYTDGPITTFSGFLLSSYI
ncbi:spindle assembly abnormal protein 6-like isoform X4 [Saccostrea echinata]|uniref:spindle assembly abnormal protein 6-like isoform X4 n=1 Tax=Saccostrea echinata TaxID=191078 RepID=UPI002A7FD8C2|nr:spindle assembly abnormal protein 6-like isoform X4 [Saccostrea echinata]